MIEDILQIQVFKPMKVWLKVAVLEATPEELKYVHSPKDLDKYYKVKYDEVLYTNPGELIKVSDVKLNQD